MCFRCQRLIKATDRENDKKQQQLTISDMFKPRRKHSDHEMEEVASS